MKFNIKKISGLAAMALISLTTYTSCLDDLNQIDPRDENVTEIYNENVCNAFLAKIYSGFGTSGNSGDGGDNDLTGDDQGSLVLLRGLMTMQVLAHDDVYPTR